MPWKIEVVFAQRYAQLAHVAYLMLAPERDRQARLIRAHRVTQAALPWWNGGQQDPEMLYHELLARIIRRTKRSLRLPGQGRLGVFTWARPKMAVGNEQHTIVDRALAHATPDVRAALALLEVLSTSSETDSQDHEATIIAILTKARIAQPTETIAQAHKLQAALGEHISLNLQQQQELLQQVPFSPVSVELVMPDVRLRRGLRAAQIAAGITVIGILAATISVISESGKVPTNTDKQATASTPPVLVPHIVTEAHTPSTPIDTSFANWPARGSQIHNKQLQHRATTLWAAGSGIQYRPDREVRLIYAGKTDLATIVVLADRLHLARYIEQNGQKPKLSVSPVPNHEEPHARNAIALEQRNNSLRYLLAPWVTQAEIGGLEGNWQPLAVNDGVTAAIPSTIGANDNQCWRGPVLRVNAPSVQANQVTLAALSNGPALTHLAYQARISPTDPARPQEMDQGGGTFDWSQLACQLTPRFLKSLQTPQTLLVWRFWEGALPENEGQAAWVSLRAESADGHNYSGLYVLHAGKAKRTAQTRQVKNCIQEDTPLVAETAWQGPSGKWYYLAAGSRQISVVTITDPPGQVQQNGNIVIVGPLDKKPQVLKIKATDYTGQSVKAMRSD